MYKYFCKFVFVLCIVSINFIIIVRLLLQRSGAVVFLLGGSGVMIYALQFFYSNFVTIISEYYFLFVGEFLI